MTTAEQIAARTADAHSADRYGPQAWLVAASDLVSRYNDAPTVEGILRSKHMRWAADQYETDTPLTGLEIGRWIDAHPLYFTADALTELAESL